MKTLISIQYNFDFFFDTPRAKAKATTSIGLSKSKKMTESCPFVKVKTIKNKKVAYALVPFWVTKKSKSFIRGWLKAGENIYV